MTCTNFRASSDSGDLNFTVASKTPSSYGVLDEMTTSLGEITATPFSVPVDFLEWKGTILLCSISFPCSKVMSSDFFQNSGSCFCSLFFASIEDTAEVSSGVFIYTFSCSAILKVAMSRIRAEIEKVLTEKGIGKTYVSQILSLFDTGTPDDKRRIYSCSCTLNSDSDALAVINAGFTGGNSIVELQDSLLRMSHRVGKFMADAETMDILDQFPIVTHQRCGKCKIDGTVIILDFRQTRSADEGATAFYMCKRCKTRWSI